MQEITQEYIKSLFTYRDGELYWKISLNRRIKIGSKVGSLNQNGYYNIKINKKDYKTHRLIFLYHNGYLPEFIDHIDRDRQNNNIENLQKITKSQNMMNSKPQKNKSSKFKGVCWNKNIKKWSVRIGINNKRIFLGYFKSETDAAIAYNTKALELFGKYVYLNKMDGDDK